MAKHCLYDVCNLSDDWILDLGAMCQMCFNRNSFKSLKKILKARIVKLGDDTEFGAYGIRTVHFTDSMVLEDVLHLPDFAVNLCSVSKVTKDGYTITFEEKHCTVTKEGLYVLQVRKEGLYIIQDAALISNEEIGSLWHRWLGHLHMADIKSLEGISQEMAVSKEK